MKTIEIYGHSDDCIEVEGDVRYEFSTFDRWGYIHLDDQAPDGIWTVIECGYDREGHKDKGWYIGVVRKGTAIIELLDPTLEDGYHHSDRMKVTGEFSRVEYWGSEDGPTKEDIEEYWDDTFDPRDHPLNKLIAAYRLLNEGGA